MKKADEPLIAWTKTQLQGEIVKIVALAGDASTRHYYRVYREHAPSLVLMDARQQQVECPPFLYMGSCLKKAGLLTPTVYACDVSQGLMLLTDFGDELLISRLQENSANAALLYEQAFNDIAKIQSIDLAEVSDSIKAFDAAFMLREMSLFQEWFLSAYLGVQLTTAEEQQLSQLLLYITDQVTVLPQCLMHRDFHSRNIMCLPNDRLGVIDYQGAVIGPIVYDLVSLLKDCYISWPREQVELWVECFYQHYLPPAQRAQVNYESFLYGFDVMGLQRHLKCVGLFSRLALRDKKTLYLSELPRVISYIKQVTQLYPSAFSFLAEVLQRVDSPEKTVAEESSL